LNTEGGICVKLEFGWVGVNQLSKGGKRVCKDNDE